MDEDEVRNGAELGGDYSAEFRVLWPDGTVRGLCSRGARKRDRHGKPVRTYGVMMDVTDRKKVEK
jgi:PAS domain-containing protein